MLVEPKSHALEGGKVRSGFKGSGEEGRNGEDRSGDAILGFPPCRRVLQLVLSVLFIQLVGHLSGNQGRVASPKTDQAVTEEHCQFNTIW